MVCVIDKEKEMKSVLIKCRSIVSSAVLCIAIGFATIPSAHALGFFGFGFGFLCGPVNSEPTIIETADGPMFLVVSMTTTVLKQKVDGKNRLRHYAKIKLTRPDGSVVWNRALTIQSLAIATVVSTNPLFYYIAEALNISDRDASPVSAFPGQCLGIGLVKSGSTERLMVTMGTMAQTGGSVPTTQSQNQSTQAVGSSGTEAPVKGQDKTVVNVWMLNVKTGAVARTFKPRAKPNWFFLPSSSGTFDIDDDGNDELVLVRARFIGEDRYDYMYESYNVISGALENTTTTIQNNKVLMQP